MRTQLPLAILLFAFTNIPLLAQPISQKEKLLVIQPFHVNQSVIDGPTYKLNPGTILLYKKYLDKSNAIASIKKCENCSAAIRGSEYVIRLEDIYSNCLIGKGKYSVKENLTIWPIAGPVSKPTTLQPGSKFEFVNALNSTTGKIILKKIVGGNSLNSDAAYGVKLADLTRRNIKPSGPIGGNLILKKLCDYPIVFDVSKLKVDLAIRNSKYTSLLEGASFLGDIFISKGTYNFADKNFVLIVNPKEDMHVSIDTDWIPDTSEDLLSIHPAEFDGKIQSRIPATFVDKVPKKSCKPLYKGRFKPDAKLSAYKDRRLMNVSGKPNLLLSLFGLRRTNLSTLPGETTEIKLDKIKVDSLIVNARLNKDYPDKTQMIFSKGELQIDTKIHINHLKSEILIEDFPGSIDHILFNHEYETWLGSIKFKGESNLISTSTQSVQMQSKLFIDFIDIPITSLDFSYVLDFYPESNQYEMLIVPRLIKFENWSDKLVKRLNKFIEGAVQNIQHEEQGFYGFLLEPSRTDNGFLLGLQNDAPNLRFSQFGIRRVGTDGIAISAVLDGNIPKKK